MANRQSSHFKCFTLTWIEKQRKLNSKGVGQEVWVFNFKFKYHLAAYDCRWPPLDTILCWSCIFAKLLQQVDFLKVVGRYVKCYKLLLKRNAAQNCIFKNVWGEVNLFCSDLVWSKLDHNEALGFLHRMLVLSNVRVNSFCALFGTVISFSCLRASVSAFLFLFWNTRECVSFVPLRLTMRLTGTEELQNP